MVYFISGHRDLSYEDFVRVYIPAIEQIVDADSYPEFVLGDYEGVDKFAMDYIYNNTPCDLTIYHMFNSPRNLPKGYDKKRPTIMEDYLFEEGEEIGYGLKFEGGFKSDEEKDSAMTEASDFDIAFVKDNRQDSDTAQNIKRRYCIK